MNNHQIIIFDGVCNLCNGAVNFIIKRDPKGIFKFAPMQSELAKELVLKHQVKAVADDSFLLLKEGKYFLRSQAALEVAKEFGGLWFMLQAFKLLPLFIRDYLYSLLAKNRYKLFGKQVSCRIPTKEERDRFLT